MVITCLGISGSGKTVFLGTLLDSLFSPANAKDGFYLIDHGTKGAAAMQDNMARADISISANLNKIGVEDGFRGFPPGTKSTRLRKFSLMQGRDSIVEIGWVDYKGGLISGEETNQNEQEELYAVLDQSTAIVVYLDAYRIATAASVSQARHRVGAEAISRILSHLESSKSGKITNILIVLTQCDAIEDAKWLGSGDYSPLKHFVKEVLGGLVEMINRNTLWHCGMVAVTAVGVGRSRRRIIKEAKFNSAPLVEDEIIDFPEPENVVESFFWLVGCEVAAARLAEQTAISTGKQQLRDESKRVVAGRNASFAGVEEIERERLKKLGIFKRFLQTTLLDDERQAALDVKKTMAAQEWADSQKYVTSEIEERIFTASKDLTKFENALQPLFRSSNNAVTRI